MPRPIYQHPPLAVYADGPDELRAEFGSTAPARTCSWVGLPLTAVLGVVCMGALSIKTKAIGLLFLVLAVVFLIVATYRVKVRIWRRRAERRSSLFGIPWTSRLTFGPRSPARLNVEVTTHHGKHGQTRNYYRVHLVGREGRFPVGAMRTSRALAERDLEPYRTFLAADSPVDTGAPRAAAEAPQTDWTYPLAHFEASGSCPLCRDPLAAPEALVTCTECRTGYHAECAVELRGCSTLGCRHHPAHRQRA